MYLYLMCEKRFEEMTRNDIGHVYLKSCLAEARQASIWLLTRRYDFFRSMAEKNGIVIQRVSRDYVIIKLISLIAPKNL